MTWFYMIPHAAIAESFVCPECGVDPDPGPVSQQLQPTEAGRRLATAVVAIPLVTIALGIALPALGVVAKTAWLLFLFGWELYP